MASSSSNHSKACAIEAVDSQLCSRCTELDLEKLLDDSPLPAGKEYEILATLGGLEPDQATASCAACQSFRAARIVTPGEDGPYRLCKVSWSCLKSPDAISWIEPRCVFAVANSRRSLFEFERVTDLRFLGIRPGHDSEPGIRKRAAYVDFSLLKLWLAQCNEYHLNCRTAPRTGSDYPILVVDCESLEIVLLAQGVQYTALSYVWGLEKDLRTGNSFRLTPSDISPLIKDSIQATLALGFRYLWVDKFCIPSSDAQKHEQISNMDKIYSGAYLTIVALVNNPQEGLPGISGEPRSVQSAFRVGAKTILSTMNPPREIISKSTWNTRAWTLQEAVLSKRCLYFSHEQVYLECKELHWCETVKSQPTITSSKTESAKPSMPWPDHRQFLQSANVDPNVLLQLYFDRRLSYSSDAINAFSGILRSYAQGASPWHHHFGLLFRPSAKIGPHNLNEAKSAKHVDAAFQLALHWGAAGLQRRAGFPSWSWAGWTGMNWKLLRLEAKFDQQYANVKWTTVYEERMTPEQAT